MRTGILSNIAIANSLKPSNLVKPPVKTIPAPIWSLKLLSSIDFASIISVSSTLAYITFDTISKDISLVLLSSPITGSSMSSLLTFFNEPCFILTSSAALNGVCKAIDKSLVILLDPTPKKSLYLMLFDVLTQRLQVAPPISITHTPSSFSSSFKIAILEA